jgi:hypothetical protein
MSCEVEAREDEEEDGTRYRAAVAICFKAMALVSSNSRRSQAA